MAKKIEMIAWFDKEGKINPIKFKYLDEEREKVIKIDKVMYREMEKLAGSVMWRFACSSIIGDTEVSYSIKYDISNNKWVLF